MRRGSTGMALLIGALLASCATVHVVEPSADPPAAVDPERVAMSVSCGGPGFLADLLQADGRAELADDPAATALRRHLATTGKEDFLPDHGWREAVRTDNHIVFIADAPPGNEPPLVEVSLEREGDEWHVVGFGQCWPQADVGPGLGLASYRVAPGVVLGPEMTEIDVLVMEQACNSGQDARGRIVEPALIDAADNITVVFAVRPRGGVHDCQSNPETPFLLTLDEPLGDRRLLDGSEVPARDATICADPGLCPP